MSVVYHTDCQKTHQLSWRKYTRFGTTARLVGLVGQAVSHVFRQATVLIFLNLGQNVPITLLLLLLHVRGKKVNFGSLYVQYPS